MEREWLSNLFKTIDNKDAAGFVEFLTQDASFRFANSDAARGKDNIRNAVSGFFSSVKALTHKIVNTWENKDAIICEGEVTYVRHNGTKLTVPFANIFRTKSGLIADYCIYIDISTLFGE